MHGLIATLLTTHLSCREMEMERLRLRDEVENLEMQLASLEGETPRAVKDDTLRHGALIP